MKIKSTFATSLKMDFPMMRPPLGERLRPRGSAKRLQRRLMRAKGPTRIYTADSLERQAATFGKWSPTGAASAPNESNPRPPITEQTSHLEQRPKHLLTTSGCLCRTSRCWQRNGFQFTQHTRFPNITSGRNHQRLGSGWGQVLYNQFPAQGH